VSDAAVVSGVVALLGVLAALGCVAGATASLLGRAHAAERVLLERERDEAVTLAAERLRRLVALAGQAQAWARGAAADAARLSALDLAAAGAAGDVDAAVDRLLSAGEDGGDRTAPVAPGADPPAPSGVAGRASGVVS